MGGDEGEHGLHVFGQAIAATGQQGMRARRGEYGEASARRQADPDFGVSATCLEQALDIFDQGRACDDAEAGLAQRMDACRVEAGAERPEQAVSVERGKHLAFGGAIGVAEAQAQHEAVELRIGQRIGAGEIERVLGGDDEERGGQQVAVAVDRHLALGHRLEQGTLCLRRRAVDFIGEQELGEQRSRMEFERARFALVDADPDNVRRQQVARELDTLEAEAKGDGKCVGEGRLANSGQVLDQQVAAGEQADEGQADFVFLAEQDGVDLGDASRERIAQVGDQRRGFGFGDRGRVGHGRFRQRMMDAATDHERPVGSVAAASVPRRIDDAARWRIAFWCTFGVLGILKLWLAANLAPFVDEAFYWQESRRLAWSYSDVPALTAWLIAASEALLGHSTLAMRAPFLLLGAAVPLLMVAMVARLFDARAAWQAGLCTLAMPLAGTLGVLALPDVPLTFTAMLALGAFERATREDRLQSWVVLGVALAFAWLAHYRAAMLMLPGLAFLLLMPRGRIQWRRPGLWISLVIAAFGLVPLLAFNLEHDWNALGFQFVERHPWAFRATALMQPLEQALVVTPLLYVLLLLVLYGTVRRLRRGAPWDLFACAAAVPLLAWFLIGLFADDERFRVHWPLPAYLPLLALLPVVLREARPAAGTSGIRVATTVAVAGALAGGIVVLAWLFTASQPQLAAMLAGHKAFPGHFVGWDEAGAIARQRLAQEGADVVLVADNFKLAAELDFALGGDRPVYTLDSPLNAKHGRAAQLALWSRDEAALRALAGRRVLLVVEETGLRERERRAWLDSLCRRVAALEPVELLDLHDGRKRIAFHRGHVPAKTDAAGPCAYPSPGPLTESTRRPNAAGGTG